MSRVEVAHGWARKYGEGLLETPTTWIRFALGITGHVTYQLDDETLWTIHYWTCARKRSGPYEDREPSDATPPEAPNP